MKARYLCSIFIELLSISVAVAFFPSLVGKEAILLKDGYKK